MFVGLLLVPSLIQPSCNEVQLTYQESNCCGESSATASCFVEATSMAKDVDVLSRDLDEVTSLMCWSGVRMGKFQSPKHTVDAYKGFDGNKSEGSPHWAMNATIALAEGRIGPQSFLQCPGAMVLLAYIIEWVEKPSTILSPNVTKCKPGIAEYVKILDEVFEAEIQLKMDATREHMVPNWMKGFFGIMGDEPLHNVYTGEWVRNQFKRMQQSMLMYEHLDLVAQGVGTLVTHTKLVCMSQNRTDCVFDLEPAFAGLIGYTGNATTDIPVLEVAKHPAWNLIMAATAGIYGKLQDVIKIYCPLC